MGYSLYSRDARILGQKEFIWEGRGDEGGSVLTKVKGVPNIIETPLKNIKALKVDKRDFAYFCYFPIVVKTL